MKMLVLFRKVCNIGKSIHREELAYLCNRYCEQMEDNR